MIGKQLTIVIVQAGFEFQGARGHVNRVVGGADTPFGQTLFLLTVPSLHRQGKTSLEFAHDEGHMGFRHGKHHGHGLGLGDADQAIRVTGTNQTAQLGLLQPQTTADWRCDLGVGELQSSRLHLRLIGLHCALQLVDQCSLCFHLLAGDGVFAEQVLITLQIELGVFELCSVARQLALRLIELGFKRSCI